jgi:transketolase
MVAVAQETATILQSQGVSAQVVSMHTVKPLDEAFLEDAFQRFRVVAVVEEHSRIGGLGSAVAEWLAAKRPRPTGELLHFGTPDAFLEQAGNQRYARQCCGLSAARIAGKILPAWVEAKKA